MGGRPAAGGGAGGLALVTTEPIDTVDDVLRIVDWYTTRWLH